MIESVARGDVATARVRRRRRLPLVWIVPIFSALIGAWLAWDTWSKRGPTITVSFETAEGLKVGQSHLKFKDIEMGTVSAITVTPDLSKVLVTIETTREAEKVLNRNAIFWVVKPELTVGRITGINTLLSGSYIEMLPAVPPGKPQRNFVGLEEPPIQDLTEPGHVFTLTADQVGSLSLGSPVFFHGVEVGQVMSMDLHDLDKGVSMRLFVQAPYDRYIHDSSHFWRASGVSANLKGGGVSVKVASLKALLFGGIAFASAPNSNEQPISANDHHFPLYADQDEAQVAGFGHLVNFRAEFPGSVTGLSEGSDVTLHGLKIGQVTDVGLYYDKVKDQIIAPVSFRIEPSRVAGFGAVENLPEGTIASRLVQRGLRATLQSSSLVFGDKAVVLDFYPDAAPAELRRDGDVFIMPTTEAGGFDSLQHSATELLGKINQIDFAKIGENVTGLTVGLDSLVNAPQLRETLTSLNVTMSEAAAVTRNLNAGSAPALHRLPQISAALQETLTKADALVASLTAGYGNDTRFQRELEHLLPQLTDAVRSIRALSDLLERHPEALLRGRSDQGGK